MGNQGLNLTRMSKLLLSILFLLLFFTASAQRNYQVQGAVQDTAGVPLAGSIVILKTAQDSLTTVTDNNGLFNFNAIKTASFRLQIRLIGFDEYTKPYQFGSALKLIKIPAIKLKESLRQLKAVNIVDVNPITIKEDTVEYKAAAYKVREGSPVEDLVKKLPGLTVDKDGNITAQGKPITKIRINGKDYFGGDVQTATQNLPADIVENLQVIDDYGDQANLTGIRSGEPNKILNITIQKNKNKGYFGQGTIAAGTQDRFAGRISANKFKDAEQVSVLGSVNNTNSNLFNFGANGSGGGGSSNTGNGITTATSAGLNYRNSIGKKITVYGSYSYSKRNNNTISTSSEQRSFQDYAQYNTDEGQDLTHNSNHRFNLNMEYKVDTSNYLKVIPNLSFSTNGSTSTDLINSTKPKVASLQNNFSQSDATSPSGGVNVLYNHKFKKRGRNFSLNADLDHSSRNQFRNVYNNTNTLDSTRNLPMDLVQLQNQNIENDNQNTRTNIRATYMEPVNKVSFAELSYAYSNSLTQTLRNTDDINPATGLPVRNSYLSNNYKYSFATNRFGLNYRVIQKKYNYTVG
ncbi:MAG: TonB-dependent receptor, partial [Sphingobacteriaceae bacterium]